MKFGVEIAVEFDCWSLWLVLSFKSDSEKINFLLRTLSLNILMHERRELALLFWFFSLDCSRRPSCYSNSRSNSRFSRRDRRALRENLVVDLQVSSCDLAVRGRSLTNFTLSVRRGVRGTAVAGFGG